MEELLAKHRTEQKNLQGRITQKKKNATKKTRKGVNDECERLDRELRERQQNEVNAVNGIPLEQNFERLEINDHIADEDGELASEPKKDVKLSAPTIEAQKLEPEDAQQGKKPNRQKARLARRAAEQEAQAAAAAEEAANQPDLREQEMTAMKKYKEELGLSETFIRPDGHCLFSACARGLPPDTVKESGPFSEGYQNVRYAIADFMSKHRNDFEPFLEEPFDSYVKKIKDTAEWGGHLELQAIARLYETTVNVLQANGRIEKFQPDANDSDEKQLWLAYYKHSFGLGEHYNALSKT